MLNALVIGPHRSGTTIVARCLAHDRGHIFIPEEAIHFSCIHLLAAHLSTIRGCVIQCPWLTPFVHMIRDIPFQAVWVKRPKEEVHASRARMMDVEGNRIKWGPNEAKLRFAYNARNDGRHVMDIQYEQWLDSRDRFADWMEVNYHDFEGHELWRDNRQGFHYRQTA